MPIKYAVYKDGKIINHRHPTKVVINNFLRLLQFWTLEKYIVVTYFDYSLDEIIGYGVRKVTHKYYLPVLYANI